MAFPLINPSHQFFDSSGSPLVDGTLEFRDPATNDLINSYPTANDADERTNANANPLTLDARGGFAGIYLEDGVKYKIILKNAAGGTEDTQDDVLSPINGVTRYSLTAQTLTDAGAVTLTESTTFLVTTGAAAISLADGTENQHKLIVMKTDGGDATLTPVNFSNGTTIVFENAGDSASLWFVDGSWSFAGGSAKVVGYTAATAVTFTSTDATPTVGGGSTFITAGTTAITDFDDGAVGQTIKILAASNITITDGTPIQLRHNVDFNMNAGETLTLHMFNNGVWEEIARSGASTGSFTPTITGFSSDPSTPVTNWSIDGSTIFIRVGFTTGTSNATTFTISNLPADLTPSLAQIVPIIGLHDNTADTAAAGVVLISGTTLTFGLDGTDVAGGGFTASGAKGFASASVSFSYSLMS